MGSLGSQDLPVRWGLGRMFRALLPAGGAVRAGLMPVPRFQGYEGLVEGGENIRQANWLSVSNIIQLVRLARGGPVVPRGVCCLHTHMCTPAETHTNTVPQRAGSRLTWPAAAPGCWGHDGSGMSLLRDRSRSSAKGGEGGQAPLGNVCHGPRVASATLQLRLLPWVIMPGFPGTEAAGKPASTMTRTERPAWAGGPEQRWSWDLVRPQSRAVWALVTCLSRQRQMPLCSGGRWPVIAVSHQAVSKGGGGPRARPWCRARPTPPAQGGCSDGARSPKCPWGPLCCPCCGQSVGTWMSLLLGLHQTPPLCQPGRVLGWGCGLVLDLVLHPRGLGRASRRP